MYRVAAPFQFTPVTKATVSSPMEGVHGRRLRRARRRQTREGRPTRW